MKIHDPFGAPVQLNLLGRHNPQHALAGTPPAAFAQSLGLATADRPAMQHYALNADVRLDEMALMRDIVNSDQTPEANRRRQLALNAFNDRLRSFGDILHGRTPLSSSSQFPDLLNAGLPSAVTLTDADRQMIDTRWVALFNMQDRRGQSNPYFKIADLYHAIQFQQYLQGERVKFATVEAEEAIFEAYIYGAGLQWNQIWAMWQDLWTSAMGMAEFQVKYAKLLALTAYSAITASGLSTTSYVDRDATGGQSITNDIATILQGLLEVKTALYTNTAPNGGQETEEEVQDTQVMYLLYNSHTAGYHERVRNALSARITTPNDSFSVNEVDFPVVPIGSPYVPTGNWYVVLPGRKNVFANFMDLRLYNITDPRIAGVAEGEVGWGAFRFVRGDVRQVRKLALS